MDEKSLPAAPSSEDGSGSARGPSNARLEVGQVYAFTYRKKDGEPKIYQVEVDRTDGIVFSGTCRLSKRILNNLQIDSIINFHPLVNSTKIGH
jgi:hypothetical protein